MKAQDWLITNSEKEPEPVVKSTDETLCWFVQIGREELFAKWFPTDLAERGRIEGEIAGANLHPAIIPLRDVVHCDDGTVLLFPKVTGVRLDRKLAIADRIIAIGQAIEALSAVCDANYTVVDWYTENMLFDPVSKKLHIFDWEVCRKGRSFILDKNRNFGSARLMAPEEFLKGNTIDERTLIYNMGRFILITVPELVEQLAEPLAKATHPLPGKRHGSMRELLTEIRGRLAD